MTIAFVIVLSVFRQELSGHAFIYFSLPLVDRNGIIDCIQFINQKFIISADLVFAIIPVHIAKCFVTKVAIFSIIKCTEICKIVWYSCSLSHNNFYYICIMLCQEIYNFIIFLTVIKLLRVKFDVVKPLFYSVRVTFDIIYSASISRTDNRWKKKSFSTPTYCVV